MNLKQGFAFKPLSTEPGQPKKLAVRNPGLGLLKSLPGTWTGTGFNAIWRPSHKIQDRFLELNITKETIEFDEIPGIIPNRGLLQSDLIMTGVRYLQQIADSQQNDAALHLEPGLWLSVPATTDPRVQASVARLASIPHGTTIVAQGLGFKVRQPVIGPVSLNPFPIGNPGAASPFPEQDLSHQTDFRTAPQFLAGVTQAMVDDPNSVIRVAAKNITETTVLQVTTSDTPILGGGTANTAFLKGGPHGPNADAVLVTATFWIEKIRGQAALQLQYTQTVILNFAGLSWPHVTVATLTKQPAPTPTPTPASTPAPAPAPTRSQ